MVQGREWRMKVWRREGSGGWRCGAGKGVEDGGVMQGREIM